MTPRIAPHVRRALETGAAVVALESTVVTHGLPRPANLELALGLERAVRSAGAVPATIGVIAGELVIGLDEDELTRLAAGGADKASLWNLAALCASGRDAGTTVATTLHAAHRAGIEVFATGGIGGVHDAPFDESADLAALARTPLVTVCAGPKSILDAAATLERLESAGVPVLGYRSDRLAGFHVPTTDLPVAARVNEPSEVAAVKRAQDALALDRAILISNPVSSGLDPDRLRSWLDAARRDAEAEGVHGKDATPFLLDALARRSDGATVEVNVRLLHENAVLAARIALALAPRETGVPA
ncbi:MAG: pseudouridine-5'-phosphate glycosidase [Trueperaceae bacterium]|nr:pseudouridine-5'-phosphate glycosidase [Trueperaceae bacterium]